jgi:hypothetical protein
MQAHGLRGFLRGCSSECYKRSTGMVQIQSSSRNRMCQPLQSDALKLAHALRLVNGGIPPNDQGRTRRHCTYLGRLFG